MPLPIIPLPPFPNVPIALGVPAVLRAPGAAIVSTAVLAVADVLGSLGFGAAPRWGIFDQTGQPVIVGDSVVGVDYRKEARVSDFQIEQGGFASFNKVATPFDFTVSFTTGVSVANRSSFLASVEAAIASLYLFVVVTPEFSYPSVNVTGMGFRRTNRNGVSLITVDVRCEEIRIVAAAQFTDTKTASGQDATNGGTVQPVQASNEMTGFA